MFNQTVRFGFFLHFAFSMRAYTCIYFGITRIFKVFQVEINIDYCLTQLTISAPITPRLKIVGINTDAPMIQHTMNVIFYNILWIIAISLYWHSSGQCELMQIKFRRNHSHDHRELTGKSSTYRLKFYKQSFIFEIGTWIILKYSYSENPKKKSNWKLFTKSQDGKYI